ncbi:hypothetical protein NPJ82_16210 (plasmid) [Sphingomonas sp. NY01]|uniref:hypothetical protein n=1 Tax=Sphingomonas sp. NY01 TaxID=2968057 RepID=UPI00315C766E
MIRFLIRRPVSLLSVAFNLAAMVCGRNMWLLGRDPEPAPVTSDALVNLTLSMSHATATWSFVGGFLVAGFLTQLLALRLDA